MVWQAMGASAASAIGNGVADKITSKLFGGGNKSSAAAAASQYQYNLALQKQAQEWNEYMYRNRYQMQVEDLEKAGINKLYGLGSAPSTVSGQGSVGMPDYVGEKNGKMQQILTGVQLGQDWSAKKAQIKFTEAQTRTENINTNLKALEVIGKKLDNIYRQKEIKWYDKKAIADLKKTYSEITKNIADANYANTSAGTARAMTGKIQAETTGINYENTKKGQQSKFYKEHPILGGIAIGAQELDPFLTNANNFVKTFNDRRGRDAQKKAGRAGTARKKATKK